MSDELKEIEIETARIKLERERMALEDEIRKRQRIEEVKGTVASTVDEASSFYRKIPKIIKYPVLIIGGYFLFALFWVAFIQ